MRSLYDSEVEFWKKVAHSIMKLYISPLVGSKKKNRDNNKYEKQNKTTQQKSMNWTTHRVVQKIDTILVRLNFIKYWLIFKPFYCHNQEKMCNNKDPTTPQVYRYTILRISVLKTIRLM